MDRARPAAGAVAAAGLVIIPAALVIQLQLPPAWQPTFPLTPDHSAGLTFPLVGAFLAALRPRLTVAWLMCLGGLLAALSVLLGALTFRHAADGALETAGVLRLFSFFCWASGGGVLAILVPLYSPDGRLPSPRWRLLVPVSVVAFTGMGLITMLRVVPPPGSRVRPVLIPNPLGVLGLDPIYDQLYVVIYTLMQICVLAALTSLAVRWRRGDPETRRQIAWPLLAFAIYVIFLLLGDDYWLFGTIWVGLIPVAIMVGVLRYRLFGIDTVVSRTFVAAGLVLTVSTVYFGVGALSSLLVSGYDQVAGLAAALFSGAFFQPMRRLLQRTSDRMLYGRAGDPRLLALRLTQEVRQADPTEALSAVVAVVRDGLAVDGAAVEVRDGSRVESGTVGGQPREIALVWHGESVGRLLIGRPGTRRFAAAHDERVIATLLPYVADVAHAARMAADLQRSRERILAAREEERRRLRRDLHDGLGQTLGAMAMTLNMARLNIAHAPGTADGLLRDLRTGMDAVALDIRQLVYGLRPPALDDLGLTGAVTALAAETAPGAEVRGEDLGELPAAVEVAAYRIVQEALTNVRRHANAERVRVSLELAGGQLVVRVADDGVGLPEQRRAGVGTASMRERAAELGGTCAIVSSPGGGTLVEARLPVATDRPAPAGALTEQGE
ncbi:sensor histidine kinase [Acrocarpospora catenulata]|uniref:sensor histidine kinase n=1 Tax=Acrocarpospora catenulata TaxID=2836182 RepID=UPI001BDB150C|nr:sensor histidine kinase [Acrocarpospora catenulata]